jgi:hypothetical protein
MSHRRVTLLPWRGKGLNGMAGRGMGIAWGRKPNNSSIHSPSVNPAERDATTGYSNQLCDLFFITLLSVCVQHE